MKPSKYNNKKNYIIALIVIIIITILCLVSCGRRNYQVTLYVDGEKFQSTTVSKNTKIQLPPDPKKEGYTFLGWYINDKKFDDDTLITKDLKLKAKFVKNTYQITFDDGMGGITNVNVKYKEQVNAPADPTRENYIFSGWYLGNEKFDFNSKISSNVKLTARWTRIVANYRVEHYLMNKDGNYNASADEVEILSGQAGSYAKAQTKNYRGYTTPNEQKVIINSNGNTVIKYYYVINQYTLTVVGDNGIEKTFGSGSYFYNDEVNVSYLLKAGYSFANYSEYVSNDIYTMPDSDVTIKVNSIANDDTKYLVEHYKMSVDGDSYLDPIVEEQMGTTDTLITPLVKEFVGFTSPESETVSINGDGSTVVKYYYQRNKYALKLEADKGIASVEGSGDYYFEAEVNVKANVKNGYTFDHWSNNQTDDEYVHIMGAKNETVKAFTSVNTYTITYNLNGGTLDNKIEKYTVESADFDLGSPSKVGYTFTGWLVNNQPSNGTIKQGTYGALNVEATFKPNEDTKYTIEYYFMGVTGEKYVQDEDLTEIKTGTTAQPINYNPKVISGFYTPILKDKNDKEVAITDLIIEPDGSTKLKYYYPRQKLTLNILFENILDPADLEGIDQISEGGSYYYEQKVTINVVVKDGFDFVKWSNNEETNTITYTMTADENQTLIAQIKRHSYTVSFNSKGGSKVKDKSVLFDKLIDEPNEPTRTGHNFDAWYYKDNDNNEIKWNFAENRMPAADITLYAKWIIHKNTVTFDANGGLFENNEDQYDIAGQEVGSLISPIETPTKRGYTFDAWYYKDNENKETKWNFEENKMPDGSLHLYAKWKANTYTVKYNGGSKTSGDMDVTTCTYDKPCKLADNKFERKYKVTYNDNDKTGNSSEQTVEYEFKDWEYNGQNFTDGYSVTNLIDKGTVELTATWQIKEETATLKEVSREGYTFAGWYDESGEVESLVDSLNDISQELNLTAHWTPIKYYVVFDGNGGKDKNGNGTITMEVEFDGENKTLSNEAFTKAYNLIYDFNNGQENFVQPAPIEFKKWLFNGEEYDANVNLGNLTITAGETFTLTAQWGDNPTVTIDEENPTNTNSPAYYKYVFTNWTDGEKDYQKNDSITLTKDITLTAMYNNIQVIPDEYFKAKMTNTRDDVTLTTDSPDNNYKYKYTVDMKKVNNSIINEVDSSKIKSILDNDDVKVNSVILETNDKNTFTIDNSANVDNQVVEFIKSVTKADDVSGKNLSSLYEKYINITINFDPTTVTTTDNTTSTTYRLHYISDYVITQSMLDSMADTGIVPINNSGKKHYKIKRNGHEIRGTYDSGDADVAVACVFSNEACFFGKKPPNGSGGTGMKESLTTYFGKNPQIEKIDILKDNADMTYVASVDSSVTSMGSGELVTFAGNVLYSMGIVSRKPTGNFLGDVALIVSIKTNTTAGKTVKIAVQLKSDYAFADGVDNIFNIKILSPSEYLTYDGIEPGVTG